MISSFKEFFELLKDSEELEKDLENILKTQLNLTLDSCYECLSKDLQQSAPEVAKELFTVAPNGDYSKLMEDAEIIEKFLKEDAHKAENWKLSRAEVRKENDQLMSIVFKNTAIDDGDILKGFVFVGLSGVIRHSFVQV